MTAASTDAALLELFASDTRQAAELITGALEALLGGAPQQEKLAAELAAAARSVLGAARIVNLPPAARVAIELERCFTRAEHDGSALGPDRCRALLAAAHVLGRMAASEPGALVAFCESHREEFEAAASALSQVASIGRPSLRPEAALEAARPRAMSKSSVDAALLDLFRTEAQSCAAALSSGLVALEAGDGGALERLMRAAHSFKGALRVVGLEAPTELAHALEECFVSAQRGSLRLGQAHVDVLLAGVDLLSELARCPSDAVGAWEAERSSVAGDLATALHEAARGAAPALPASALRLAKSSTLDALPVLQQAPQAALALVEERVVRVSAASINRLMGLAGESLVESRRVEGFTRSLQRLKRRQVEFGVILERLEAHTHSDLDPAVAMVVADVRALALDCRNMLLEHLVEVDAHARRTDDLSDRLYREALKSRMRPFRDGVQGLPRIVRDVAREVGKSVRLELAGEGTDVDRDVLESLDAPLSHLLRNAVDHGIEGPEARVRGGKAEQGIVRVEARHHAGMLTITVSDDGAGIDPERIRQKIIERDLLVADVAVQLSQTEVLEFIFLPGFSTASGVTHISGRGVGLDAVRTAVEAASGTVRVTSELGRGTTFHLQLPVTRSVLRAVVTEIAGEPHAFPLLRIERVLRITSDAIRTIGSSEYCVVDGHNVALVSARQVLGFGAAEARGAEVCVVVVGDRQLRYGLVVDKFLGEHDLVVRPLDPRLGKVQDIAAAAILMDGAPALIVDVDDIVRSVEKLANAGRLDRLKAGSDGQTRERKRILVVDDSITVREAERQLLSNRGYEVDVAVDGVDGWNSARNGRHDLLIVDIDMPRMNGIELVRTVRQDQRLATLPIVIVSYKDREEDRMRGLDAGANYYLTKSSFHDDTLVRAVEDLIGEGNP